MNRQSSALLSERGRRGVLLINLGTPAAPQTGDVRRYLREFLSDRRVIDIHPVLRAMLVNLFIAPLRAPRSARAYASVWTDEGSPLLVHSSRFAARLAEHLPEHHVELAMRYGEPSIPSALARLRQSDCSEIAVLPLYPQYASSSTGSALEKVYRESAKLWSTPYLGVVSPFYEEPGFIEAWAQVASPHLETFRPDYVLFSYHGLPERHLSKGDAAGHCLAGGYSCCARICAANRDCYRAQCAATTRALAEKLSLEPARMSMAFQSRLLRSPWIGPYTDHELQRLAASGVRKLAVLCPSFVADCLETLEEIGLRGTRQFQSSGGEQLLLIPCLNDNAAWVAAAAAMVRDAR